MKSLYFIALFLVSAVTGLAQLDAERLYKPFKVDLAVGYVIPNGSGIKGGGLAAVEPKYAVLPQLNVGIRFEAAGTGSVGNVNDPNATVKIGAITSYIATSDYYFKNADFRPFAGMGLGAFNFANFSVNITDDAGAVTSDLTGGVKFGGMLRSGFEYKHFRLGLEYNLVSNKHVPASSSGGTNGYNLNNSYFSIKVGFTIGGGLLPE